jgi:protein phosphatase
VTSWRTGAATDVGLVRANNQDRFLVAEPLFAVADGMGGHAAGEVASATAVTALAEAFTDWTPTGLAAAARAANRAVWDQAQTDVGLRGMGTTLVALAFVGPAGAEELAVAHVGDSRLYLLRGGELAQVTADHSLVAELVLQGQIRPEEAEFHPQRHVLTRALGVDPDVAVDLSTIEPAIGDRYLLCSDGLSKELSDPQVGSVLRRLADPEEAARELVQQAKDRGGNDNITVIVVDVVADDAGIIGDLTATRQADGQVPSDGDHNGSDPSGEVTIDVTTAQPAVGGPAATPKRPRWWRRRSKSHARTTTPLVTLRVVGFFGLFAALLAMAFGGVTYYARQSYYVGLKGPDLVIYQGRPGGVLWFKATVADRTDVVTSEVLGRHLSELRAGVVEGSLDAARRYIANLRSEYRDAHAPPAASPRHEPSTSTTPTTVGAGASGTTTVPTLPPSTTAASSLPTSSSAPSTVGASP